MRSRTTTPFLLLLLLTAASLPTQLLAADTLSTTGLSSCQTNSTIQVTTLDLSFDRSTSTVTFDAAGESDIVQNVTAAIDVSVYGVSVYNNSFNPCDSGTYVEMLCPGTLIPLLKLAPR